MQPLQLRSVFSFASEASPQYRDLLVLTTPGTWRAPRMPFWQEEATSDTEVAFSEASERP